MEDKNAVGLARQLLVKRGKFKEIDTSFDLVYCRIDLVVVSGGRRGGKGEIKCRPVSTCLGVLYAPTSSRGNIRQDISWILFFFPEHTDQADGYRHKARVSACGIIWMGYFLPIYSIDALF